MISGYEKHSGDSIKTGGPPAFSRISTYVSQRADKLIFDFGFSVAERGTGRGLVEAETDGRRRLLPRTGVDRLRRGKYLLRHSLGIGSHREALGTLQGRVQLAALTERKQFLGDGLLVGINHRQLLLHLSQFLQPKKEKKYKNQWNERTNIDQPILGRK